MTKAILGFLFCSLLGAKGLGAEPRIEDVDFESHGVALSGSIAFPEGQPTRAAVVFIHGSGKQARSLEIAKRFAESGVAALVPGAALLKVLHTMKAMFAEPGDPVPLTEEVAIRRGIKCIGPTAKCKR